ncbi:MAG: hypothetical protein K2Z81_22760, partial [Cyanobacteria bacterium]|nr:hypothetical protein [Cyanobacteriota bacterium]
GGGAHDATGPRQVTDQSTSTADDIVQRRGDESPVEPGSGGRETGNGGAQDATRPQPMPDRPASTAVDQRQ